MLSVEGFSIFFEVSIVVVLFWCKVVLRSCVFSFVVGCKGGCGRNYYYFVGCFLFILFFLFVVEWGFCLFFFFVIIKLIIWFILILCFWFCVLCVVFGFVFECCFFFLFFCVFVLSLRLYCFRSYLGFILGLYGFDGILSWFYCLVWCW